MKINDQQSYESKPNDNIKNQEAGGKKFKKKNQK